MTKYQRIDTAEKKTQVMFKIQYTSTTIFSSQIFYGGVYPSSKYYLNNNRVMVAIVFLIHIFTLPGIGFDGRKWRWFHLQQTSITNIFCFKSLHKITKNSCKVYFFFIYWQQTIVHELIPLLFSTLQFLPSRFSILPRMIYLLLLSDSFPIIQTHTTVYFLQ